MSDSEIAQFISFTGANAEEAEHYLQASID
jgi:hypothetical protein